MPQVSKARGIRNRSIRFVLALAAMSCRPAFGQSASTQSVDIAVRIFRADNQGAPLIKDRDFHFSDLGRHQVHVERFTGRKDDPPVFALLDFANCANPDPLSIGISTALDTMFALRWRVSLLLPAGRQTPFVKSQLDLATTTRLPDRSEVAAIESLDQNVGRHVVFALCTTAAGVPRDVIDKSNQVQAPLFTFRAGAPTESPAYEIPPVTIPAPTNDLGQPTSYFSNLGGLARSRYLAYLWPLDQPTLQDAIRTAQQMSDQFFLLHLEKVPNEPELRLNVHLPGGRDTKYRVIANSYAQGATPPHIVLLP